MLAMFNGNLHPPPYSGKDQTTYDSLFNKSIFIAPQQIETEQEFDQVWDEHVDKSNHFYRGQREAVWQLYTTGQRKWIDDRLHESEESYGAFMQRMVANARTMYGGLLVKYLERIGMDPQSDIAVLSFLQHYGGPTPLQDWTFSFGNAVFFAMDGIRKEGDAEADHYFSVYHIEDSGFASADLQQIFREAIEAALPDLSERSEEWARKNGVEEAQIERARNGGFFADYILQKMGPNMVRDMASVASLMRMADNAPLNFFSDREDFPWLSFSMNNSLNIRNQRGVFLWNHHEALPTEQVGRELHLANNDSDAGYKFCRCFNINKKLEGHIRKKLNEAGITHRFIYPDPTPMEFGMDPWAFAREVYEMTRDEGRRNTSA
ncbi:MAG: FRG domain-containing protein [Flavobacteriales bacterium]|nr:MAG: FRG domain-containing protein [Flavobacteriales bacterium]